MVAEARKRMRRGPREVHERPAGLEQADFTVASGVFNVKQDAPEDMWSAYVIETIDELAHLSSRGFAFNALTAHADPERRRADLFYADPAAMVDHRRRVSVEEIGAATLRVGVRGQRVEGEAAAS